jgi:type IV pilus assembly protein PilN
MDEDKKIFDDEINNMSSDKERQSKDELNVNNDVKSNENITVFNEDQNATQSSIENNKEHKEYKVIHKKDGRLHIYVRQDKYKGELKSKNWVGRVYIDRKQKISSSGTQDLEEAIPILEKWFDDLHAQRNSEENNQQNKEVEDGAPSEPHAYKQETSKTSDADQKLTTKDNSELEEMKLNDRIQEKKPRLSMFEKLKNIKFGRKKNTNSNDEKINPNIGEKLKKKGFSLKNIFKSRVSKLSVAGEEIAGLDVTRDAIRVSQVSQDKDEKWILDKFSYRLLDQEKISENILENKDYVAEEISLALSNAKITSKNIAMSIPVTSAIIKVVTSPLMTDEELQKAIDTDSLWENLVQLTDNLNDYSVFHQVINRNSKTNTMEILFVASKLSDVNEYSNIVKKAGLNPVIIDVKCFTLKNAHDNTQFKSIVEKSSSAILELGPEENYLMIIHNNIPVITDIFLRQPEKEILNSIDEATTNTETDAVVRRYAMQIKQALADYEAKYENKINNIQVVSSMKNILSLLNIFKKNLPTVGFHLFDPLEGVAIPSYNKEKTNIENRSTFASVIGLAYRKLDVFGYYKFVTAVKNINLLPNRETLRQKGRLKFLTGFAFKGIAAVVAAIYLILIVTSYFQIKSNNEILNEFDQVQLEHDQLNSKFSKLIKRKREIDKSLELGKLVSSNQVQSYRALAQISRSVPLRVNFTNLKFDGKNNIIITGLAFSDQDILNFISNLNSKTLIAQASLTNMKEEAQDQNSASKNKKGFTINCILKGN